MRRPQFVHFTAVDADDYLTIRASVSFSRQARFQFIPQELDNLIPTKPIEALGLMSSREFRLRLVGLNDKGQEIHNREYDSDSFGNFYIRLPHGEDRITKLQTYETSARGGLDLLIGSFIPIHMQRPSRLVVTDFDKTLVDTRYSSMKEVFISLRNPVEYFPAVPNSIELIKRFIEEGFLPFIVSASPHFYENAIRDWLYKHGLFTSNIFLKDYRKVFSLFEGDLGMKDLKTQGFYKLNQIVNILLMTGIPDELVLVGDGFESDTIIYLTLASVLVGRQDPWMVWNSLKQEESFRLSNKQHFRFLSKFYQLKNMSDLGKRCEVKIFIRCKPEMQAKWKTRKFKHDFLNHHIHTVEFYVG